MTAADGYQEEKYILLAPGVLCIPHFCPIGEQFMGIDISIFSVELYPGDILIIAVKCSLRGSQEMLSIPTGHLIDLGLGYPQKGKGVVVINQNYFPGWKIREKGKKAINFKGLIGAEISEQDTSLEFYYLPKEFIGGCFLSLTGVLVGAISLFIYKRGLKYEGRA